jgi:hypothetical protein
LFEKDDNSMTNDELLEVIAEAARDGAIELEEHRHS